MYFNRFGLVLSASVARLRETGRSRGYGFVKFAEPNVTDVVLTRAAAEPLSIDGARVEIRRARPPSFPSTGSQQQQHSSASARHPTPASSHSAPTNQATAAAFGNPPVSAAAPRARGGGFHVIAPANGMQAASDAANKVFIGGIDHTVTELTLRNHFQRYGEVASVNLLPGKAAVGARAKPFAFLTFGQPARQSTALSTLAPLWLLRTVTLHTSR